MLTVNETIERLGFRKGTLLGEGAYAEVYELEHKDADGNWVVDPTRIIKVTGDYRDAYTAELARKAQEQGRCQNIVRVYKVLMAGPTDKCPCGDPFCHYGQKYIVIS